MNARAITIVACLFSSLCSGQAQDTGHPVYQKWQELHATGEVCESTPFYQVNATADHRAYVRSVHYYALDDRQLKYILREKPTLLALTVPGVAGDIRLGLYQSELFSSSYRLHSTRGPAGSSAPEALFYRGAVLDNPQSVAAVSILPDEIRVMYSDTSDNYRIHRLKDGNYVFFKDADLLDTDVPGCEVGPEQARSEQPAMPEMRSQITGNCVEVYFECDYESYLDNDASVPATELWISSIFNEVSTLYDNEGVPVSISEIFVWDTPDPYIGLNSTGALLNAFVDRIDNYNYEGRLAHLVSTRGLGGGIAYINVLCSNSVPCAVSASLSTNVVPFPNYSWTVNVIAHEMGHNFGSPHTHDCAWNGNNTAFDGCGPEAGYDGNGNCADGPLPESGTVMSYCHLVSGVGINFNNGFGDQPGDLILSKYQNAPCNTGECAVPICTGLESPPPGSAQVDVNMGIQWDAVAGAAGYRITMGTSPGSGNIVDNLDVGLANTYDPGGLPFNATIYVKIIPYNSLGDATGCQEESFSTEPNVQPACTALTNPLDNSTDVDFLTDLRWAHAVGNQSGYILNVGTTPGGGQFVNDIDAGNVTTYDPGMLPDNTMIYVQITPYGAQGETQGCPIENFATVDAAPGDFCDEAIPISCGQTLEGNTEVATYDDMSSCGTSNTAPGIWYTFAGFNGIATFSTCDQANFDTKLTAYRGSCGDLDCITGLDDTPGCSSSTTTISFGVTAGETYYVLVHGWSSSVGTYDITMTCEVTPYCFSQGNIIEDEWIAYLSLANFAQSSGASQYTDYTGITIDLALGESYPVEAAPGYDGTEYNEYFRIWIDWNQDDDFSDTGEMVFQNGPATDPVDGAIAVPTTAATGPTRMRVSMKYNSYPSPCETFTYGEVEDYTVNVRCNVVNTLTDFGPGSLPFVVGCVAPGDTVLFSPSIHGQTISLTSNTVEIGQNIVILADPADQITVQGQTTDRVFEIAPGTDVELAGLEIMAGSASSGAAITNNGFLVLRDVRILRHPGGSPDAALIYNPGSMTLEGACEVQR